MLAIDAQGGPAQSQNATGFAHLQDLFVLDPFHGLSARPHQAFDRLYCRAGFDQARSEVKHAPAGHHGGISLFRVALEAAAPDVPAAVVYSAVHLDRDLRWVMLSITSKPWVFGSMLSIGARVYELREQDERAWYRVI